MSDIPSESSEQIDVIQWCNRNKEKYPLLCLIFAIPNGGVRHIATAARLKLEGVKKGVPDLMLPVARKGYHGLFIEMKRIKGGSVSPDQKQWKENLREQGYAVVIAKGAIRAITIIAAYLDIKEHYV